MSILQPSVKPGGEPTLRALMLVQVNVSANPNLADPASAPPIRVTWSMQVLRMPGASVRARQVHVQCTLAAGEHEQVPYTGNLLVAAEQHFTGPAELSDREMDEIAAWSSANMLVGMARTQLQALTALGPYPQVLLHAVNIIKLLRTAMLGDGDGGELIPLYPDAARELTKATAVAGPAPQSATARKVRRARPKPKSTE
ncbi:MAG TPA: hypothetical protein VFS13_00750 [Steroidobacteraceae bacterium]|nr:hypothetical protein [Steroidobacteraceae bacterium]